jgi:hypothetical protein
MKKTTGIILSLLLCGLFACGDDDGDPVDAGTPDAAAVAEPSPPPAAPPAR